jgi:4-(gamma-glutamylamino)butanal dehydrogenase
MNLRLEIDAIQAAVANLRFRQQAFIDGAFVEAQSGKTFTTENPATGQPLAQIAECDAPDVDRAVQAARKAFESGVWSRQTPADRKRVLLKFADLLETNLGELALLDTLEAGKPIGDCATMDLPDTIHCIRWHAETIDKLYHHVSPTGPENLGLILREPVGAWVVSCRGISRRRWRRGRSARRWPPATASCSNPRN